MTKTIPTCGCWKRTVREVSFVFSGATKEEFYTHEKDDRVWHWNPDWTHCPFCPAKAQEVEE